LKEFADIGGDEVGGGGGVAVVEDARDGAGLLGFGGVEGVVEGGEVAGGVEQRLELGAFGGGIGAQPELLVGDGVGRAGGAWMEVENLGDGGPVEDFVIFEGGDVVGGGHHQRQGGDGESGFAGDAGHQNLV
jgi:hypothetical protein